MRSDEIDGFVGIPREFRKDAADDDDLSKRSSEIGFSECERLVREAIKNSADALDSESKSRVSVRFNCRRYTSDVKESLSSALSLSDGPLARLKELGLPPGKCPGEPGRSKPTRHEMQAPMTS